MLWLSLYFPHLPLEVYARSASTAVPLVVYTHQGARQWVLARNRAAAAAGISPGMALGAAASLSRQLQTRPRDEAAEEAALAGVAAWAGQFTPVISLQPPDNLLLEIEASLNLFGGLKALRQRLQQGLEKDLGYRIRLAAAPTPLGARLLSRIGFDQALTDLHALRSILHKLPLAYLELDQKTLDALQGMGLRELGDCLSLPRSSLAKRLGPGFMDYLDRVLGAKADPRLPYHPPARFHRQLLLPAEVDDTEALLFAAQRLINELCGFLLSRGSGVQTLGFHLQHTEGPDSRLELGLVTPSREAGHLVSLLRERLERFELPAPVIAVELEANQLLTLDPINQDLLAEAHPEHQDWPQLVERLQARLGADAVKGLAVHPDHRPERAWQACPPGEEGPSVLPAPRPLWLLDQPEPLAINNHRPQLDGELSLVQGPERIESGWWDGGDIARDYFVAENPHQARFWIYRERRNPRCWYLHGVFA